MWFYRRILRPIFFLMPPETAHHFVSNTIRLLFKFPGVGWCFRQVLFYAPAELHREYFDLPFPNLVGLPAGFDKQAQLIDQACNLGFGFTEIGTVTPKPQPGNPQPRMFRLPLDGALVNRMGFNSEGATQVAMRLAKRRRYRIPVGGNIGKNSATPNEQATQDYLTCFRELYPLVDYFAINISCPNVHGLCGLQDEQHLRELLAMLVQARARQRLYRPMLLKLGPDTTLEALTSTLKLALEYGIDGFIASNTTAHRDGLHTPAAEQEAIGAGGLSGQPLHAKALALVRSIRETVGPEPLIIGVGGISNGPQALAMLQAGANLLQVFTGYIYGGPATIRRINKYLYKHRAEIPDWGRARTAGAPVDAPSSC